MEFEDADPCNIKIVEKYQKIFFWIKLINSLFVIWWSYKCVFALVYSVTKLCSFRW